MLIASMATSSKIPSLTFCFNVFVSYKDKSSQAVKNSISKFDADDTWEDVLLDLYQEPLKKTDKITVSVSKSTNAPEKFHPDLWESIQTLSDFDIKKSEVCYV